MVICLTDLGLEAPSLLDNVPEGRRSALEASVRLRLEFGGVRLQSNIFGGSGHSSQ